MSAPVRFGPYELVRRLGTGGMAETYLGVRRGPGGFEQEVCVKRILPAFESDPELVRQFLEEARLAAQLRHSNIVQVVDFGEVAGSHYLALELVDGMDLRTLLRRMRERSRPLEPPLAVYVGLELAAALDAAHRPGRGRPPVIHRDISPSNVLLSRAGEVYLTDFGIARAIGSKRRTDSGVVRGKVPYMAPEYAMHGAFDARSDLFSVGVVLYEALAGRRPFDGLTDLDTLTRIQEGRHDRLDAVRPGLPPALVATVERLLHPHPEQRPQSAGALLEALADVSPPPTVARQLGELVRRNSHSLSDSLRLSLPSHTAALPVQPPPAYPPVAPADADAATRTSDPGLGQTQIDPGARGGSELWRATDPSRVSVPVGAPKDAWKATDPTQISQHDRPSPYAETAPAPRPAPEPAAPSSASRAPAGRPPLAATRLMNEVVNPGMPAVRVESAPPSTTPAAAPSTPPKRRGGVVALLVVLGLVAFALASAGAYALVHAWRIGA
ncbi:MAG TPA: serine/threonine-protein kinase, partial [Sandaracinaceae bacterium LLY-WYZ-13_1]|nr:serine/threonine-protein kinase [Sandaracinaceae bacterium LLY-WYZ-13_1]